MYFSVVDKWIKSHAANGDLYLANPSSFMKSVNFAIFSSLKLEINIFIFHGLQFVSFVNTEQYVHTLFTKMLNFCFASCSLIHF